MKKYDIVLVNLDPTVGHEIKKTRPCLIVSPDEMNSVLGTLIVVPLTSIEKNIPTRIRLMASDGSGLSNTSFAALDQIKTIDKRRVIKTLGHISDDEKYVVTDTLHELFDY